MSETITKEQIEAGECSGGDPCYSVAGHVNETEMLAAVRAFEGDECGIPESESDFTVENVRHIWRRNVGPSHGYDEYFEWKTEATPGYEPVTVVHP